MCLTACAAVYPELATPVRPAGGLTAPDDYPRDLYFLYFEGAELPHKTRDGRSWAGGAPDPYAKLIVDERELLVTPRQSSSFQPTWPNQTRANYRIRPEAKVVVELWDANPLADHPLCVRRLGALAELRETVSVAVDCDSGARLALHVGPPAMVLGLGFFYELRGSQVRVTRVVAESPASRAGLHPGERLLSIQGRAVGRLRALEIQSLVNKHARDGLRLEIASPGGGSRSLTLTEGPMYPLRGDAVELPQRR